MAILFANLGVGIQVKDYTIYSVTNALITHNMGWNEDGSLSKYEMSKVRACVARS
jgi:hypothetical protein